MLDAAGFALVLIETVGTGQSEVEVAAAADTTVVLEAPEMGDEVQAIKAGLLEVADMVVVNKADRPGAQRTAGSSGRCSSRRRHARCRAAVRLPSGRRCCSRRRRPVAASPNCSPRSTRALRGGMGPRSRMRPDSPARTRRSTRSSASGCEPAFASTSPGAGQTLRRDVAEHRLDPYAAADELLARLAEQDASRHAASRDAAVQERDG